jgi:hypothetical protein
MYANHQNHYGDVSAKYLGIEHISAQKSHIHISYIERQMLMNGA